MNFGNLYIGPPPPIPWENSQTAGSVRA